MWPPLIGRLCSWMCALGVIATVAWLVVAAQTPEPRPSPTGTDTPPRAELEYAAQAPVDASPVTGSSLSSSTLSAAAGSVAPAGSGDAALVSAQWAAGVSQATGIPERAVRGYAGASLRLASEAPSCHLGWTTLAALGAIESGHGTHAGSAITPDGVARPAIYGPMLDGATFDAVADTDQGRSDQNSQWDRAVGPLQFIPSTWQRWGADGNGDGLTDAQQIDDAALAAGRYLCNYGDLSVPATWRTSIFAYNHVESYVNSVAATANEYAAQGG